MTGGTDRDGQGGPANLEHNRVRLSPPQRTAYTVTFPSLSNNTTS